MLYHAPAKINLTLEVLAKREDGYHALRSVMVPLALSDELEISPAERFAFACDTEGLGDDDNLVVKAARALGNLPAARLELRKRIPSQAGLGGGSSDAATVLLAAMDGAFGPVPPLDWVATARALGSDVPFFLCRSGALVEGTGERVTAVGTLPGWHVLVIKPPVAISTAAAFAQLDRRSRPTRPRNASVSLTVLAALQRGDFHEVERGLSNDFHDPAASASPLVAQAVDALHAAGARHALLSGSGSCVYTLTQDERSMREIEHRLCLDDTFGVFPTMFARTPAWRA
jgi:4-diphosphocytidyl-2-C-methyl-D-erythritol kinase